MDRGGCSSTRCCIWVEREAGAEATPINGALVSAYYSQLKTIAEQTGIPEPQDWFTTLLRMPDVMTKAEVEELTEEEWQAARQAVDEALANLVDFRKQEGAALQKKFEEKLDNIAALLAGIEPYEKMMTGKK